MSRKLLFSAMVCLAALLMGTAPGALAADQPLSPATLKQYANELNAAFPERVDIYLISKDYDFSRPAINDAHIAGCAQVAGVLYYVITLSNKSELFVPQSQVQAIHNRKEK